MLRLSAYRATPRVFSLSHSLRRYLHADHESKYSDKLRKRAQEWGDTSSRPNSRAHVNLPFRRLGKSLNEIRQEIKEAESLRLKQWSEERERKPHEEDAIATPSQKTSSGVSTSRPDPAPRRTSRKDNSPVKVQKPGIRQSLR